MQPRLASTKRTLFQCADRGRPFAELYFDDNTKLLVRMMRYLESPLGRIPIQIDYDDYRDAGGVKIPFRQIITEANGSAMTQLERVESNVPIDAAEFAKPLPDTGSKPSGK